MAQDLAPRETPEERELESKRAALAALETELAQRELDFATLQGALRAFEARYVRIVGVCYAELDELEARLAEATARRNSHDQKLGQQAAEARARATESASATDAVQRRKQSAEFAPSDDLKKLYRDIARRVHPDLTTDEKERVRRNRVMSEANRAYEEGDEAKLRTILDEWRSSPESVEGEGIAADLVRTIRKIHQVKQRLAHIETEFATLERSDLYRLKEQVETAQSHGQDLLAEMADQLNPEIAHLKARLDALTPNETGR